MRVCSDEGIGICQRHVAGGSGRVLVGAEHNPSQVLEINLVYNAGVGGNHPKVFERSLPPAKELVPFAIALIVQVDIGSKRLGCAEGVHLNRVINYELDRLQRVYAGWIAAQSRHRVSHRGQVHDGRNTGEVLEQDARGRERNFSCRTTRNPARQSFHIFRRHNDAILGPEQILEENAQGVWKTVNVEARAGQGIQPKDLKRAAAYLQSGSRAEGVVHAPR